MRTNGGDRMRAANPRPMSAWSSGRIDLEVEGHAPIVGAVECSRLGTLVLVIARFDTTDPDFLSSDLFPFCASTVELWPELSVAAEPIAELGASQVHAILARLQSDLQQWEKRASAVREAFDDLRSSGAVESAPPLQDEPSKVS